MIAVFFSDIWTPFVRNVGFHTQLLSDVGRRVTSQRFIAGVLRAASTNVPRQEPTGPPYSCMCAV
jgi:hypothetical protein